MDHFTAEPSTVLALQIVDDYPTAIAVNSLTTFAASFTFKR